MTSYSIMMPFMPTRHEQALSLAGLVRFGAAERLWHGQSLLADSYHTFNYLAGSGLRVPTGFGVSLMPLRHPFEAAIQAQSLACATGHSVVAGYGPGAAVLQESVLGSQYAKPLTATREYVGIVRDLLDGNTVERSGEYYSCRLELPKLDRPRIDIGLGVLRPRMALLAGEVADVAICWLTPSSYIRDVIVPNLAEGAAKAGRPMPRLIAIVPTALAANGRDPVDLVLAGNAGHLRLPHYQDMLRRSGIDIDPDDPRGSAERVLRGRAFLSGDPDEIAAGTAEYVSAGADEVVLNATGICQVEGLSATLEDLEAILGTVTA